MSTTRPPAFDERYTAPTEASRRGAHRSRPNPLVAALPLVVGAALTVLVVAGAWTFFTRSGGDDESSPSVAAAPTSTPAASASGRPSAKAGTASKAAQASDEPSKGASASPSGTVDEDAALVVLNSISSQGLAARVAADLKDEGWTVSRTGNANQRNLETTRVYYARSREAATAEAVVDALGFGEAVRSAGNAAGGITVVLGNDAR